MFSHSILKVQNSQKAHLPNLDVIEANAGHPKK